MYLLTYFRDGKPCSNKYSKVYFDTGYLNRSCLAARFRISCICYRLHLTIIRGHSHITLSPRGRNDYANVIFPLSNAEFDYGGGGGGLESEKKLLLINM